MTNWVSTEDKDISWEHCGIPAYWEDENVFCSKCQEELPNRERGAAGIIIQLADSEIWITHLEEQVVLRSYPMVSEGTWSLMFDTITKLLEERELQ